MSDEKYVVIKREMLDQLVYDLSSIATDSRADTLQRMHYRLGQSVLDDAVVLRLGDVFAGPALAAYSAGMSVARSVAEMANGHPGGMERAMQNLVRTADYFADRSAEAIGMDVKLPD